MTENNPNKRDQILSEISKKDDIRATKPEYRAILDVLQTITPTTKQDLLKEINDTYECEIFTYKQLYDHLKILSELKVIENTDATKQVSINPEYIIYPESLPISSYCIYIFSISAIFLIASIATKTMLTISIPIFFVGILYLLAQHFGSKFDFKR